MDPVRKERASADYERPEQNVADLPDPVTLSTNKARQGIPVRGMRLVLTVGIVLALAGMAIVYLFTW
jgi:hypothetical protein